MTHYIPLTYIIFYINYNSIEKKNSVTVYKIYGEGSNMAEFLEDNSDDPLWR